MSPIPGGCGAVLTPPAMGRRRAATKPPSWSKPCKIPSAVPRLRDLAQGAGKVLVITSDHTRPVPSRVTMPPLLREIRSGNPDAEIRILLATGFHRPTTRQEMMDKFGSEVVDHECIINHCSEDDQSLVMKGVLPSGGEHVAQSSGGLGRSHRGRGIHRAPFLRRFFRRAKKHPAGHRRHPHHFRQPLRRIHRPSGGPHRQPPGQSPSPGYALGRRRRGTGLHPQCHHRRAKKSHPRLCRRPGGRP